MPPRGAEAFFRAEADRAASPLAAVDDRLAEPRFAVGAFADGAFDQVRAVHFIEHASDVIRSMEEFHRLVRPGGRIFIVTPHYTDFSSFCDPTHRWHLNSFSFRYFGEDHAGFGYYSPVRLREISVRVKLLAFWRALGFEFLVNRWRGFRRFWEYYLCFVVRGKVMEFEFERMEWPVG